jgi:hypothetical protein
MRWRKHFTHMHKRSIWKHKEDTCHESFRERIYPGYMCLTVATSSPLYHIWDKRYELECSEAMMTYWTFTASEEYATSSLVPSIGKYCRETSEKESEYSRYEKEKKHN